MPLTKVYRSCIFFFNQFQRIAMTPAATSVNEVWLWVFCYLGLHHRPSDHDHYPCDCAHS
jgi:hypothetical protein